MLNRLASVLIASILGSASAALAQSAPAPAAKGPPSTTVAPVTVQAAPTPKAIVEQSRSFVQSYAAAPNPEVDQIGRWHDPVCVQVAGLPQPDQAAAIKARIESVAKAVGLPAARKGCKVNIEIVFSDHPQAVMDEVAQRRPYVLGYYHRFDANRLKTVTRPIQAWYVTETKGGGGDIGSMVFANIAGKASSPALTYNLHQEVVDDADNSPPVGCGDNHFTACLKSMFNTVFVVADSKTVDGKDLGIVADYMTMLALSQPRSLDGCGVLPSVIDRFAKSPCPGRDPPDGLTRADAAYLTALYSADLEARMAGEQSDIAGRMAKILINARAVSR